MRPEQSKQEPNQETTAFNMSLATLERINEIFKYNNQCCLTMNTQGWLLGLETLLVEVSPMMSEEDEEKYDKLSENIMFIPNPQTENAREMNFDNRKNIQKADTFLRKILWNKGLTMTKKEDIRDNLV